MFFWLPWVLGIDLSFVGYLLSLKELFIVIDYYNIELFRSALFLLLFIASNLSDCRDSISFLYSNDVTLSLIYVI